MHTEFIYKNMCVYTYTCFLALLPKELIINYIFIVIPAAILLFSCNFFERGFQHLKNENMNYKSLQKFTRRVIS